jgi:hypothetical protein
MSKTGYVEIALRLVTVARSCVYRVSFFSKIFRILSNVNCCDRSNIADAAASANVTAVSATACRYESFEKKIISLNSPKGDFNSISTPDLYQLETD